MVDKALTESVAQPLLPRRIEFVKATFVDQQEPSRMPSAAATPKKSPHRDKGTPPRVKRSLPSLFPREELSNLLEWKKVSRVGGGLLNLGNTCFLNSVLQCLTYTPPLANYLGSPNFACPCGRKSFCLLCELHKHIAQALSSNGQIVKPVSIVRNIRLVASHFRLGREEDAHEFLRYTLTALQKCFLRKYIGQKMPKELENTTFIDCVFGGYLVSKITCFSCKYESCTKDPFLDLSLEIQGCTSLDSAIEKFSRPEILDGANKYKCPKCRKMVKASKQFMIGQCPPILTVQLKRFVFTMWGEKITKHVSFPRNLDLPLASGKSVSYNLFAVLVHSGGGIHCGHYYAFVKSSNGLWYHMNDAQVKTVSIETVLQQNAYILFYSEQSAPAIPKTHERSSVTDVSDSEETVSSPPRKKPRLSAASPTQLTPTTQQTPPTSSAKLSSYAKPTSPVTPKRVISSPQPTTPTSAAKSEIAKSNKLNLVTSPTTPLSKISNSRSENKSLEIQRKRPHEESENSVLAELTARTSNDQFHTAVPLWNEADAGQVNKERITTFAKQRLDSEVIGYKLDDYDLSYDKPKVPKKKKNIVDSGASPRKLFASPHKPYGKPRFSNANKHKQHVPISRRRKPRRNSLDFFKTKE